MASTLIPKSDGISTGRNRLSASPSHSLVPLALGINAWLALVVVPGTFVNAWQYPAVAFFAGLAPLLLCLGIYLRSDLFLLFIFPFALLLPYSFAPQIGSHSFYHPALLALVAASLLLYLFFAALLSSNRKKESPIVSTSPLGDILDSEHWHRRRRMYRLIFLFSIFLPMTILFIANFGEERQRLLNENFGDRAQHIRVVINLGIIVLWFGVFSKVLLPLLEEHRRGARTLRGEMRTLRKDNGRLSINFYLGIITIILALLLFFIFRQP